MIWVDIGPQNSWKAWGKRPGSLYGKKGKKSSNMEILQSLDFCFQNHDQCMDSFHVYSPFHSSINIQANHKPRTRNHHLKKKLSKFSKLFKGYENSKTNFQISSIQSRAIFALLRSPGVISIPQLGLKRARVGYTSCTVWYSLFKSNLVNLYLLIHLTFAYMFLVVYKAGWTWSM